MTPVPSWSIPRPPSGKVTDVGPWLMVNVLLGPKPWPTTLIAMDAMPLCASVEATANGAPCLLSVNPWPNIATGQPLVGRLPDGMNRLKNMSCVDCTGTSLRVATAGMKTPALINCLELNFPKAMVPMEPGKTCKAARSPIEVHGSQWSRGMSLLIPGKPGNRIHRKNRLLTVGANREAYLRGGSGLDLVANTLKGRRSALRGELDWRRQYRHRPGRAQWRGERHHPADLAATKIGA